MVLLTTASQTKTMGHPPARIVALQLQQQGKGAFHKQGQQDSKSKDSKSKDSKSKDSKSKDKERRHSGDKHRSKDKEHRHSGHKKHRKDRKRSKSRSPSKKKMKH
jgi:hypothetical protein